jgi:hypothetical protein
VGLASLSSLGRAQCVPEWNSGYQIPGVQGTIYASTSFDDGTGPKLYIGGQISFAGATRIFGVARWTGTEWERVGDGFFGNGGVGNGKINVLTVYNGQLYAGGEFQQVGGTMTTGIARLNAGTWETLTPSQRSLWGAQGPNGLTAASVKTMHVHNGSLYIGGVFSFAANQFDSDVVPAQGLVRYDGASFSEAAQGQALSGDANFYPVVNAITSYDGDLVVAGAFAHAASVPNTTNIVRLSNGAWVSIGSISPVDNPLCMTTYDEDGPGPVPASLVVGGWLNSVGIGLPGSPTGVEVKGIARWNGSSWSAFGDGLFEVNALKVVGPVSSPTLYAASSGEDFAGDRDILWVWNGDGWSRSPGGPFRALTGSGDPLGEVGGAVLTLCTVDFDGSGPQAESLVAAGGSFDAVGSTPAINIAKFDGSSWGPINTGKALWISSASARNVGQIMNFIAGDEDGVGPIAPAIYAYGNFVTAGSTVTSGGFAKLNGTAWEALGSGPGFPTRAAVFHDDGSGTKLYACSVDGSIARWEAGAWTQLTSSSVGGVGTLKSAASFHGSIYIGGNFTNDDGTGDFLVGVCRWDGTTLIQVASADVPGAVNPYNFIEPMIAYNGALYAGGQFKSLASGSTVTGIARWDGTSWQMAATTNNAPKTFVIHQGVLYVGGQFATLSAGDGYSGGATSKGIAKLSGTVWSNVGTGMTGSFPAAYPEVWAMTVGDDGTGPAIFLGGKFLTANGVADTRSVAKYTPATNTFSPLGSGITSESQVLAATPNGGPTSIASLGNLVLFGGTFNHAGSTASFGTAAWGCPSASTANVVCCRGVTCTLVAAAACTVPASPIVGVTQSPASACGVNNSASSGCCFADFTKDGNPNIDDIFVFLNAWFAGSVYTDVGGNGTTTPNIDDIFVYLGIWFSGCN